MPEKNKKDANQPGFGKIARIDFFKVIRADPLNPRSSASSFFSVFPF